MDTNLKTSNGTKHTVFITGAAGYVGAMLVQQFAKRDDVERIIGLDKEEVPELIAKEPKLTYIRANMADLGDWYAKAHAAAPDIVINTAWQIREMYGNQKEQWRQNVGGSDNIFDFAFNEDSVRRLVHFSTVASYGAYPDNEIEHYYKEEEPFRKSDYLYAEEKRVVEEHLCNKYDGAKMAGKHVQVAIIRPAAITGPRGRFMRIRFGLQSALSGQLKGSFVYGLISKLVAFVPVTPKWCRQFVHEDDIVAATELLAFGDLKSDYEAFNICPPGEVVRGSDMAKAVGKKVIPIPPLLVRVAFFFFWHLTRGKVPTARGAWKSYSYPIAVDGSKLTRMYGLQYAHSCFDAFYYSDGKYEEFVPEEMRRSRG